jgi:hypothetical protein
VFDGDRQVGPWALPDIFAPFRAEYYEAAEFGSLCASSLPRGHQ